MLPRAPAAVRCAVLACAVGAGAGGCGVVDEARARVEALLGEEAAPVKGPEEAPVPEGAPAEAPVEVVAIAAAGSGGAAGSTGDASEAGEPEPAEATDGGTGLLPMSYARPPEPTAGDPAIVPPTAPTVPTTPEPAAGGVATGPALPCLEGEWDAEDLHTLLRRDVAKQAHGRPVRYRGESGRYRLRFEPDVLHGKAVHRRVTFDARLADVDVHYGVDVHGSFEAKTRFESPDVLVVDRPTRSSVRVREVVRFSTGKSESRTLTLPVEGRWQVVCGAGTLELRPLEDGKAGPAITFSRPKP